MAPIPLRATNHLWTWEEFNEKDKARTNRITGYRSKWVFRSRFFFTPFVVTEMLRVCQDENRLIIYIQQVTDFV